MSNSYHTIIIGAGAAGLHCAAYAANAGRTLVIDHAKTAGEKIRISGGGRCNFTNLHSGPDNFISQNPHFAKSALARYTQWDFIDLVTRHAIPYHEKALGQLFCDTTAKDIIKMLMAEMQPAELRLQTAVTDIRNTSDFALTLSDGSTLSCKNLVIATGGKSIPKMGATGFGYQIARQFGLPLTNTRAGLVPLTFSEADMSLIKPLAGVALPAAVTCNGATFEEAILFTHRGLSGPAILQASSYWHERDTISVNLLPGQDVFGVLRTKRSQAGRRNLSTVVADLLPARLAAALSDHWDFKGNLADQSDAALQVVTDHLTNWQLTPTGTEGYRTAEVTIGGVSTDALNSRTMQANSVPGLYFIGEVVDVTGWLGGYNFQWAWSSAHAAGTAIADT